MGERILHASVEGSTERLNVLLLVIIEDTFGKGPRAWLRPEGLMAAMLLTLKTSNLLEKKPHGWVDMREKAVTWSTPDEDHQLVRLGVLNILGKVLLGALGMSLLLVTLQGTTIMLQLNVPGTKMFVFLQHLGNTSMEALHFCLEIDLY
ncbi:unnamed protein product [Prunus brigantina]